MVQDWRFDDLTRTLGKATSRRQVLKGLVGGLVGISVVGRAAGVSAQVNEECDSEYQHCLDQADFALKADLATCIGYPKEKAACKRSAKLSHRIHQAGCVSKHCSCPAGTDACHSVLGFVNFGPTVCCEPSEECQHTWLGFAKCEPMCDICEKYDPDDPNEPCKPLECPECQICDQSTGQCTVADDGTSCGTDQVCCAGACTSGDTCDYCKGQLDGVQCGQGQVCCQEHCTSNQCPANKEFSYDTCQCACTAQCPPDQLQDPETCACQDLCANKTCGECETCDPTSGDCVPVDNGTTCSEGTCCDGACTTDGGSCCDENAKRCYDQTGAVGPCCPTGQGCVAEVSDEAVFDNYTCCPIISGSGIGEDGRPYPALPGGTCCSGPNYWAVRCPGGWTCCDSNNGGLCC